VSDAETFTLNFCSIEAIAMLAPALNSPVKAMPTEAVISETNVDLAVRDVPL
jgi:hypothetical protein